MKTVLYHFDSPKSPSELEVIKDIKGVLDLGRKGVVTVSGVKASELPAPGFYTVIPEPVKETQPQK